MIEIQCSDVQIAPKSKIAFVALSNGLSVKWTDGIETLKDLFQTWGYASLSAKKIYEKEFSFVGTGQERAANLMEYFQREDMGAVFDVSGGDLANEVLSYLDYDIIEKSDVLLWGYSDLTAVINAIYTMTGKPSVLYQIRNIVSEHRELSRRRQEVKEALQWGNTSLFQFDYRFLQGNYLSGILVGGNIRCLLKLAGTKYFPEMKDKVLFLESRSGDVSRMAACLSQLQQMGVFEQIRGIVLGTFTEMESQGYRPGMEELVCSYVSKDFPVVKTREVGHDVNARALLIGGQITLQDVP